MDIFYARSSSATQDGGLDGQIARAKELGIKDDDIYPELISGKDAARPQLQDMLRFVRKGDVVHVTKLDRLARSVSDLFDIVKTFKEKKVQLKVLDQQVDTTTSAGRAFFGMLAVFAEFERDLIRERQREGIARYHACLKADGLKPGPKPKVVRDDILKLRRKGKKAREIMQDLGISKSTYYRALSKDDTVQ
jgi:DNA invertase Pin-like site-specific DNA recombinase